MKVREASDARTCPLLGRSTGNHDRLSVHSFCFGAARNASHIYAKFTGIPEWWRRAKVWCTLRSACSIASFDGEKSFEGARHFQLGRRRQISILVSGFASVPSTPNVWRSTGAPAIKDTALRLYNDEGVSQCFSHMPGGCLRGRWFSFDGVESIILGRSKVVAQRSLRCSAEAMKGGHLSRPKISVQRQMALGPHYTRRVEGTLP